MPAHQIVEVDFDLLVAPPPALPGPLPPSFTFATAAGTVAQLRYNLEVWVDGERLVAQPISVDPTNARPTPPLQDVTLVGVDRPPLRWLCPCFIKSKGAVQVDTALPVAIHIGETMTIPPIQLRMPVFYRRGGRIEKCRLELQIITQRRIQASGMWAGKVGQD